MAFSETVSQTVFNTRKVIDSAMRRCRVPAQTITGEHIEIAKDQLFLLLSAWANDGAPLWCVEKQLYGLTAGRGALQLDIGTVDLRDVNLRSMSPLTGTETATATYYSVQFDEASSVSTVGVLWDDVSVPLSLEVSDDGATWTVLQTVAATGSIGEWTWVDVDTVTPGLYFRVRATSGVLSYTQVYLGNRPNEIPIARLNHDDYTSLPDKTFQSSRPLQFWFDRQVRQPVMHLWPVPSAAATTSLLVIWRHRHIMDVGTLAQEIEVPQRWYEALVAGLAAKLVYEIAEADMGVGSILDGKAEQALYKARAEERDNSPVKIAPNISAYTS